MTGVTATEYRLGRFPHGPSQRRDDGQTYHEVWLASEHGLAVGFLSDVPHERQDLVDALAQAIDRPPPTIPAGAQPSQALTALFEILTGHLEPDHPERDHPKRDHLEPDHLSIATAGTTTVHKPTMSHKRQAHTVSSNTPSGSSTPNTTHG